MTDHLFAENALKAVFTIKRLLLSLKKSAYATTMVILMIVGSTNLGWGQTYKSQFISMDIGSTTWNIGETRNVKVTVKNIGTATWTDGSPDVNIGVKWNAWSDYNVRVNAAGLTSGSQREYTLPITAPCSPQTENLTFDVVKEADCWFAGNSGSCGPGNSVYKSANITIATVGNPSVFGNGVWNVYGYNGGTLDLTGTYYGYYTESNLSYNTLNRWGTLGSPSDASGWQGCYVPVDNHVVVSKRTNFTSGCYQLDMPNHDDDVRVYINGTLVWSAVCCSAATNIWQGYLTSTSTIEVRHLEYTGGSNQSLTVTFLSVGDPSVFGNGVWNVYGYNGGNLNLTGSIYYGYYTESNLSYNTLNRWCTTCSPSDASGWQGCTVPVDNHVVVSKRTNFTCGYYQLDMPNHDDDVRLYINGTLVWSHEPGCCDAHTNIWTGYLTSSSTVEVRHIEFSGGSNQSLTFNLFAFTIGTQPTSPTSICVGGTSGNMTAAGSGGFGTFTYQWQYNNSGTWGNVSNGTPAGSAYTGATSGTFSVAGISTAGSYQYQCIISQTGLNCGQLTTNTATVTVVADPVAQTITGTPASGTDICLGGSVSASFSGGSGGTGTITNNYQYSLDGGSTWFSYTSGSSITSTSTGTNRVQIRTWRSATGSGCDNSVYNIAQWTVVADPGLSAAARTNPTICAGGLSVFSSILTGGTAMSYQWQYSMDNVSFTNVVAGTPAGSTYWGEATTSMTVSGITAAGTYYYRLTATSTGNGCTTTVYSTSASLIVYPTPAVTSFATGTICSGIAQNYDITSGVSGATFTWSRAAVTGISNSSVSGQTSDPITEALTNTTTAAINVVYLIIPNANGCSGPEFTYSVTVNPLPTFSVTKTNVSCFGGSDGSITVSIITGTTPYEYSSDNGLSYTAQTSSTTHPFNGLNVAGSPYLIRVRDGNTCVSQQTCP